MIKQSEEEENIYYEINKMRDNPQLSITTLNLNDLNSPIERHKLEDWIKKHKPLSISWPHIIHLTIKDQQTILSKWA